MMVVVITNCWNRETNGAFNSVNHPLVRCIEFIWIRSWFLYGVCVNTSIILHTRIWEHWTLHKDSSYSTAQFNFSTATTLTSSSPQQCYTPFYYHHQCWPRSQLSHYFFLSLVRVTVTYIFVTSAAKQCDEVKSNGASAIFCRHIFQISRRRVVNVFQQYAVVEFALCFLIE